MKLFRFYSLCNLIHWEPWKSNTLLTNKGFSGACKLNNEYYMSTYNIYYTYYNILYIFLVI